MIVTRCRILAAKGRTLTIQVGGESARELPIGDALVFATGTLPELSALDAVKASGVPYTRIGDCNVPGDFLNALRDASMVVDEGTITSHIKRLRKKFIAMDAGFDAIESVYGMGYRWRSDAKAAAP